MRLLIFSTIGFLSKEQSVFIDKMSQVVVHESTADAKTSSDDELDEGTARREVVVAARRMLSSKDTVDARLINVFRLMTARSQGRRNKIQSFKASKGEFFKKRTFLSEDFAPSEAMSPFGETLREEQNFVLKQEA